MAPPRISTANVVSSNKRKSGVYYISLSLRGALYTQKMNSKIFSAYYVGKYDNSESGERNMSPDRGKILDPIGLRATNGHHLTDSRPNRRDNSHIESPSELHLQMISLVI